MFYTQLSFDRFQSTKANIVYGQKYADNHTTFVDFLSGAIFQFQEKNIS